MSALNIACVETLSSSREANPNKDDRNSNLRYKTSVLLETRGIAREKVCVVRVAKFSLIFYFFSRETTIR